MTVTGIDCLDLCPSVGALKAKGIQFVTTYLSPMDGPRRLSIRDYRALCAAGIGVICIFQPDIRRVLGGSPAGISDLRRARRLQRYYDIPASHPVFYSADIAMTDARFQFAEGYFRAIRTLEPERSVGVYGPADVCERLSLEGLVTHTFQTLTRSAPAERLCTQIWQQGAQGTLDGSTFEVCIALGPWINGWPLVPPSATAHEGVVQ